MTEAIYVRPQLANEAIADAMAQEVRNQMKSNGNVIGGRPKLDREKVWELSYQKRCWYCGIPVQIDAVKCPKCQRARFEAWGKTQIAKFLQISERTVYRALEEKPEDYKPEALQFILPTDLEACESIKNWREGIRRSGSLSTMRRIPPLIKAFEGKLVPNWKCHPDRFDLEKAKEFVSVYLEHCKVKKLPPQLRLSIRSFLASKNIAIPRGMGSQFGLGGEKESYGLYAHIKLTDAQIHDQAQEILKDDLETRTFFNEGVETCARSQTLAKTEVSKIDAEDSGLVTIRVYESKTEKPWTKYLLTNKYSHAMKTWQDIQAYMKQHPDRRFLFLDKESDYQTFEDRISKKLRELYQALGLTDPYFYMKPIHSLRHIGAHLWLRRTKYDYFLVAKIGGWSSVQTLIDCYGELDSEAILQKIKELEKEKA